VRGDALVMVTTDAAPGRTLYKWHANGTVTSVPAPSELYAQAMSDNGKIVGFYAVDMMESRGVTLADDGTTTDLGGLPGDTWTKGTRINETGDEIVGYSGAPGSRRAVVWRF
jgi:uncharacterized membrane protein